MPFWILNISTDIGINLFITISMQHSYDLLLIQSKSPNFVGGGGGLYFIYIYFNLNQINFQTGENTPSKIFSDFCVKFCYFSKVS